MNVSIMEGPMEGPPTPSQLRYIAILTLELGLPEPHIDTFAGAKREIAALLAEKQARMVVKQKPLVKAVYNTLAWNGEPMWYESIADTVKQSQPQLKATSSKVLTILQGYKSLFQKITAGTYFLASKVPGKQYPLM